MLHQYRHPARMRFVELPAGLCDVDGEGPLEVARRELREEASLEATSWTHLLTFHSSPGVSAERIEVYLAEGLSSAERGDFEPQHEEADMTVSWVSVDDLVRGVLDRRVTDGPTLAAVLAYVVRAQRPER